MATVENPYEMLGEKNVSSARSETEVSFRIDDLVGEAMELVPDRAGVDRSLLADITCALLCVAIARLAKHGRRHVMQVQRRRWEGEGRPTKT